MTGSKKQQYAPVCLCVTGIGIKSLKLRRGGLISGEELKVWMVYMTGKCTRFQWLQQPAEEQSNTEELPWVWTTQSRRTGIQHARPGGFASGFVCLGVCGPGKSRGEACEAVWPGVPESCCLHLWRLPLEEILDRSRHEWWGWFSVLQQEPQYKNVMFFFLLTIPCVVQKCEKD